MRMAKNVSAVCLSAEIFLVVFVRTAFCLAFCWEKKEKNAVDESRAVISSRQPAIIAGYSAKYRRLLHSRNDTESLDTEQVWPADSNPW